MKLKEVLIRGHALGTLQPLIAERPGLDAIIITNPPRPPHLLADCFPKNVDKSQINQLLHLKFDDVATELFATAPREEHIVEALDWVSRVNPETLVIACHMGVSRSSALAVVLAYGAWGDISKAFSVLDLNLHAPNALMMKLAVKIFDQPKIWDVYREWHRQRLDITYNNIPDDLDVSCF